MIETGFLDTYCLAYVCWSQWYVEILQKDLQLSFLPSRRPSCMEHGATGFWSVWTKNNCSSVTTQCILKKKLKQGPVHLNDYIPVSQAWWVARVSTAKISKNSLSISWREPQTQNNYVGQWISDVQQQGLLAPLQCRNLAKSCFKKATTF